MKTRVSLKYFVNDCGIEAKKIYQVLELKQSKWFKPHVEFNIKRIEAEKNGYKDGKTLYELMNNAMHGKTMENFRNRIDERLVINKKHKMDIKTELYVKNC